MTKPRLVLFASMVATVMLAQPVGAGALTSVIEDPTGDFFTLLPQSFAPSAYQDIVRASLSLKDGRFVVVIEVAAPIPSNPTLPPGVKLLEWSAEFDTDLTTVPTGFPWAEGLATPPEYVVFLVWDGTSFTGVLIDRRPSLAGGEAAITPIALDVKKAEITASVDAARIAYSGSFLWIVITRIWFTNPGTFSSFALDGAPDPSSGPATWPS